MAIGMRFIGAVRLTQFMSWKRDAAEIELA